MYGSMIATGGIGTDGVPNRIPMGNPSSGGFSGMTGMNAFPTSDLSGLWGGISGGSGWGANTNYPMPFGGNNMGGQSYSRGFGGQTGPQQWGPMSQPNFGGPGFTPTFVPPEIVSPMQAPGQLQIPQRQGNPARPGMPTVPSGFHRYGPGPRGIAPGANNGMNGPLAIPQPGAVHVVPAQPMNDFRTQQPNAYGPWGDGSMPPRAVPSNLGGTTTGLAFGPNPPMAGTSNHIGLRGMAFE